MSAHAATTAFEAERRPRGARPRGSRMMRGLRAAGAALALSIAPGALSAQSVGGFQGVSLGASSSKLVWSPEVSGSHRRGVVAGAFVDVPLPGGVFRVRAEVDYAQRGGFVDGDVEGDPLEGEVRGEYLSGHLQLKLPTQVGPAHLFLAAGFGVDQFLRSREDPILAQVLFDEKDRAVLVSASAGIGFRVATDWIVEAEGRWVEGLGPAYAGSFLEARNRSLELLVKVGRLRESY